MKVNIIAQYHPAAALHQPRLWATMLDDWANLPERVDAHYIVTTYNSMRPKEASLDTENAEGGGLGCWSLAYRDPQLGKELWVEPHYGAKPQFEFPKRVIMHNAKWDLGVLQANKMKLPEEVVDTMIAAYCLGLGKQDVKADESTQDTGTIGGLGLKYLARRHLGLEMKTWNEVKDAANDVLQEYNATDSAATFLLWEKWKDKLPQHFWDIDMPLLRVIMAMEDRGIAIDPTKLGNFGSYLSTALEAIELPLNPYSPQQLQSYVYGELGIEPFKFTEGGAPSVDEEVLEAIDDPIIKKVLEFKRLSQEKNTYVSNYTKRLTPDGRIHPTFKQTRTATGRLSSAKPNLQNVPLEGGMRSLFVASNGKKLIDVDWVQLEFGVLAAIANDPVMITAFQKGDVHQETADALGLSRHDGKTVNFLMQYGGTPWKISREFHVPIDEAKLYLKRYYRRFPAIAEYHAKVKETAKAKRKVTNWFGRVRRMDALYAEDWRVYNQGLREAINTPIQGTAAEIVKIAMIDLHYNHSAPILLQVHDELVLEVDGNVAESYAQWLREYLPTLTEINGIRFPVAVGIGDNWREAKESAK